MFLKAAVFFKAANVHENLFNKLKINKSSSCKGQLANDFILNLY